MLQIPKGQTTDAERAILRSLRVWIAALALACLAVGVGIGAMLTRQHVLALDEQPTAGASAAAIARAPEALSASFAEIARRVEPAAVNIDTGAAAPAQAAPPARAREGRSASSGEIPRRVEPAVVNIDTVAAAPAQAAEKDDDKDDD